MSGETHHDEGGGHFSGAAANKKYNLPEKRNLYHTNMIDVSKGDAKAKMEELRVYFHNTWEIFERVFDCMNCDEAYITPPIHKLRHPMIFYYGHTCSFYINKLVVAGLTTRINPKFEEMFAIGVDEMSWDDLNEAHYSWPKVEEVKEYRQQVRDRVDELIQSGKFTLNLPCTFDKSTDNDDNAFWWIIQMGIEHERIHLETASVHIREMPMKLVNEKQSFWEPCRESGDAPTNELIEVKGQDKVLMGRQLNDGQYGWDTDYSNNHTIDVADFKASKFLVSNAEYLEFVKDGGYTAEKYWDKEGWGWVSWKKPEHPYWWIKDGDNYKLRVQTEEIPLPKNWPVDVNWLEGKAFCNWKSEKTGKKLRYPTEAEWNVLHDRYVEGPDQSGWERGKPPGNINMEVYRSSCPVDKFNHGPFFDIVGNVWQHTETPIYPYPGYKVHPYYDDFSLPTYDGRHASYKGGAWVSTGNEASRDARFGFRRHFYQMIGIRYVEGPEVNEAKFMRNVLGLDTEVDALTDFAFGPGSLSVPNFNVAIADFAKAQFKEHNKTNGANRALDLYCGAGATTFQLTSMFNEVIGSDFSARRLIPAFSLSERQEATYSTVGTNGLRVGKVVDAKKFAWNETREKATFYQAFPDNLHSHMKEFDLIIIQNTLERHFKPTVIPPHVMTRLNKGGIMIIAATFDWNESITPREEWMNGKDADDTRDPEEELEKLLKENATLVGKPIDLPAYFPRTERCGELKNFRIFTFRKN